MATKITNRNLFDHLREVKQEIKSTVLQVQKQCYQLLLSQPCSYKMSHRVKIKQYQNKIENFLNILKMKWSSSKRTEDKFLNKEKSWLEREFITEIIGKRKYNLDSELIKFFFNLKIVSM